jgi:MoaA/NifB/PqqE/SkfB family radical SAM enzyme
MRNFGLRSMANIRRFERRQKMGEPFFPAFMMISVTERCNLACSGCWVSKGGKKSLSAAQLDGVISGCKARGSYFFGILGGEPLMHGGLLDTLEKHPDCYFQLFTNGTLLTDGVAQRLRRMGNVTPVISIEGLEGESDSRRGAEGVWAKTLAGVRACRKARLIFGAAASICRSNFDELVSRDYLELLAREGAHYLWYYIYRPVGAAPDPGNALDREQIAALRRFIVEQRRDAPLFIVETYWDESGKALCPGATGLSHHISPSGAVEFCPPLQMAVESINDTGSNLTGIMERSEFLAGLRRLTAEKSRGCILLDDPHGLVEFLEAHGAIDTTARGTVMEELRAMTPMADHDMTGGEIAEQNPFFRLLKKRWFFGFGAYG